MFQLCEATIIRLCIVDVHKEGNHIAVAVCSIIKLSCEISSVHKIFVVLFG